MTYERNMGMSDTSRWIHEAIDALEASDDEISDLHEIFDSEGFGGRERSVDSLTAAATICAERLEWLRQQRSEGA